VVVTDFVVVDGFVQETQRLMQEPVPGINAVPDDNNARYFHVVVAGKCRN
jgi:hypothetical protein